VRLGQQLVVPETYGGPWAICMDSISSESVIDLHKSQMMSLYFSQSSGNTSAALGLACCRAKVAKAVEMEGRGSESGDIVGTRRMDALWGAMGFHRKPNVEF
jgi:hypothetical protein